MSSWTMTQVRPVCCPTEFHSGTAGAAALWPPQASTLMPAFSNALAAAPWPVDQVRGRPASTCAAPGAVPLPTAVNWAAQGNEDWLTFSSFSMEGLTYSPIDPMFSSNNTSNKTCVWWMSDAVK